VLSYLPGQARLLRAEAQHILFVAGVASGKTRGGAMWAAKRLWKEPGTVGFISGQTYSQLSAVVLPAMIGAVQGLGLAWTYGRQPPAAWGPSRYPDHDKVLSVHVPWAPRPAQVLCRSMENFQAHRGLEFGWYWLDEARDMDEEAYDVVLSRLRGQPPGTRYGGVLTTTPNGFGWLHRRFVAEPSPGQAVLRARTMDNPYLPAGYVDFLRSQYTERFAKQELDGEFLNLTAGQMFYAFARAKCLADRPLNPKLGLWYSQDFNVAPLCAVYGQNDAGGIRVLGEVRLEGSGATRDAAIECVRRHEATTIRHVTVYGDRSGQNRDTRGNRSDYDIIRDVFQGAGWRVDLRPNHENPPLVPSVERVNAALERGRLTIAPCCKNLIRDLEQCAWQEGSRVPDKSDGSLTHLADALRYAAYKMEVDRRLEGAKSLPTG
jgi:phage terminase large subunit-like protein